MYYNIIIVHMWEQTVSNLRTALCMIKLDVNVLLIAVALVVAIIYAAIAFC